MRSCVRLCVSVLAVVLSLLVFQHNWSLRAHLLLLRVFAVIRVVTTNVWPCTRIVVIVHMVCFDVFVILPASLVVTWNLLVVMVNVYVYNKRCNLRNVTLLRVPFGIS